MFLLPGHEDPGLRALPIVKASDEFAKGEGRLALLGHAQELDQVRGLGKHEKHATGGSVGVVGEGAGRRSFLQPALEVVLVERLQCFEKIEEGASFLFPQFADHVGDEDAAGFKPDVLGLVTGLGDELVRDAIGVGGVRDLGEGRPIGAAGIERVENDVAALGAVIMGNELAAGIIDQRRFAARRDPVKQLAQHRRLAAAGRADHRHVPGFEAAGKGDATDSQRTRAGFGPRLFRKLCLAGDLGAAKHMIPKRPLAAPRRDVTKEREARQPCEKAEQAAAQDERFGDTGPSDKIGVGRDGASRGQIVSPFVMDHDPGVASAAGKP